MKDCEQVLRINNDLTQLRWIFQQGLEFLSTKIYALTIACFAQQARNCILRAKCLAGIFSNRSVRIKV